MDLERHHIQIVSNNDAVAVHRKLDKVQKQRNVFQFSGYDNA